MRVAKLDVVVEGPVASLGSSSDGRTNELDFNNPIKLAFRCSIKH